MAQQKRGPINGLDPLIYTGSLPNMVIMNRRPNPTDGRNWPFGYFWMIPTPNPGASPVPSNELWILVGKNNNLCKWIKLLGAASLSGDIVSKTYIRTPGAGNHTFHPSMIQCSIEIIGGGGSSTAQISDGQHAVSAPGGGGGYCVKYYNKSDLNSSVDYVVGAGGVGNNSGGAQEGVDGQDSTLLGMTAGGGKGGSNIIPVVIGNNQGGKGGVATGGDLNINGLNAIFYYNYYPNSATYTFNMVSFPGGSFYGSPSSTQFSSSQGAGLDGADGSGGGSIVVKSSTDSALASNGGNGLIIITEYLG